MYGADLGNGFAYQPAFDWGSRSNTTFGKNFSSLITSPPLRRFSLLMMQPVYSVQWLILKTGFGHLTQGLLVQLASLVYKAYGYAALLVSMRDFSG